jgi:hypothetical protein
LGADPGAAAASWKEARPTGTKVKKNFIVVKRYEN